MLCHLVTWSHEDGRGLAAADPTNIGWQRDLSVSHERLEATATAAGDLATARDHYQASLDIWVKLTATDPTNAQWRDDLAYVQQRIAELEKRSSSTAG